MAAQRNDLMDMNRILAELRTEEEMPVKKRVWEKTRPLSLHLGLLHVRLSIMVRFYGRSTVKGVTPPWPTIQ